MQTILCSRRPSENFRTRFSGGLQFSNAPQNRRPPKPRAWLRHTPYLCGGDARQGKGRLKNAQPVFQTASVCRRLKSSRRFC
ncbi:hypothetical protein HMPREF9123_0631 [Neisseria bacilliformis ATCC BAA-1200]|uniref:Uncharacterized protein n=1 Tax=Neisseria bacilliformis ATCC BAA-1200 TaxID=888742 RepID=F2BA77_9NEIS|nr:hypothetical protein HMPREF9123_0631 [Neisseria bacilliformis ATCC BAA-1200]